LKIAICEDEPEQQFILENLIHSLKLDFNYEIHKFSSGAKLVEAYKKKEYSSIIFLDMKMEGMDGIQTAEIIKGYDKKSIIIIVTSILEYAIEGYRVNAFDFLLKPIKKEKLEQVLRRAFRRVEKEQLQTFVIEARDKTVVLPLDNILYVESCGRKTNIVCETELYINKLSISETEQALSSKGFVRISRYYLVNMKNIKEIGIKEIVLYSGISLVMSERLRDKIKIKYMGYRMEEVL